MCRNTKTPFSISLPVLIVLLLTAGVQAEDVALERGAELLLPFKKQLQAALLEGMQQGPVHAIETCRLRAPEIAADASRGSIEVGRTSHRLRNPTNRPPDWVRPLLQDYADAPGDRTPRAVALTDDRWGYVEPIILQPLCLTCHGERLAPDTADRIRALYPDDQATGFKAGDLRGVFWTTFPVLGGVGGAGTNQ